MGIDVRLAKFDDLCALQALAESSPNAAHWGTASWQQLFATEASPRLVLLGQQQPCEAPLGFIVAACSGPDWEIENIVVADEARGRGIASGLITEVLNRARAASADSVCLEVRDSNTGARLLYEKLGFAAAGRRPAYYSEPSEDAVVYRFQLLGSPAR